MGDGLSLDAIVADYRDGVLSLTIPVAETAAPRRISVNLPGAERTGLPDDLTAPTGVPATPPLVGATTA